MMEGIRWLPLLVVVLALAAVADVNADYTKVRSKRDLIELGSMISSVTGKNLFSVYTSYNGYGCYCGVGGKGRPVDDVDRCCQTHDRCFGAAQRGVCSGSNTSVYSQRYKYTAKTKKTHSDGMYATIQCNPLSSYDDKAQGLCARAICSCDSDVATCFAKHKYNGKYGRYDRTKCK